MSPSHSLDALADKLLREWAARKAASEAREVGAVLREAGIMTNQREQDIMSWEIPASIYTRSEEEQED